MPVPRGKNDRPTKLSMTELLPELYKKTIMTHESHVINIDRMWKKNYLNNWAEKKTQVLLLVAMNSSEEFSEWLDGKFQESRAKMCVMLSAHVFKPLKYITWNGHMKTQEIT